MSSSNAAPTWLFIDLAPSFGGHEVMLLRWIEQLQAAGNVRPILICQARSRLAASAAAFCQVETVESTASGAGKLAAVKSLMKLAALCLRIKRRHAPECTVVAEGSIMSQRHGLYVARLLGMFTVLYVPLVASFASMNAANADDLDRRTRKFYGRLPHAWLTITAAQADDLRGWARTSQPILLLPNTVTRQIEAAANSPRLVDTNAAARPLRVLVLGRLDCEQKGLDLLMNYLSTARHLDGRVTVHVVGEGPYGECIEAMRRRDDLLQRLVRIDSTWSNPAQTLLDHDVLLITSRFEGVPLVMLEAMCVGVPVVATDLPGTRDYLEPENLYPIGRLDLAFERLLMLGTRNVRERAVENNLQTFRTRASAEIFAQAVSSLTSQVRSMRTEVA
jgi:glycosyltransferase involved in cell wall biosynthesis